MELLSPAGSLTKLAYAYRYGADAAYIGLPLFSLRARAENLDDALSDTPQRVAQIKGSKKLYAALNIYFHNPDLGLLKAQAKRIAEYPFDAFIVSDIGALEILRPYLPDREFHLSTQANCTNWAAAKMYYSMGFSRIVPGREVSLDEIRQMKQKVPDLEIEAFAHGAMCMSYSGRCFLSAESPGRSANRGDCAHNCRWDYRLSLEEETRPGEFMTVETGQTPSGSYTALLSSKDLNMIDYLQDFAKAGVDSIKIEGRMKSLYYTALVTRAYRWGMDHIDADPVENPYRIDLYEVSHREYNTGFYFDRSSVNIGTMDTAYQRSHLFLGSIEGQKETGAYLVGVKNSFSDQDTIEVLGPSLPATSLFPGDFSLLNSSGDPTPRIGSERGGYLVCSQPLETGFLLRKELLGGKVRE
ncbi:MAG: U32 family peptidase [Spirochaetales bacterium]|nr:U32 family peptidase [Spirochaetales bacterium]